MIREPGQNKITIILIINQFYEQNGLPSRNNLGRIKSLTMPRERDNLI